MILSLYRAHTDVFLDDVQSRAFIMEQRNDGLPDKTFLMIRDVKVRTYTRQDQTRWWEEVTPPKDQHARIRFAQERDQAITDIGQRWFVFVFIR
jgi:hypothetical protein